MQLSQKQSSWHFHILTKDCMLNDGNDYALILESPTNKEFLVCYCSEKPLELGQRLVKLLHGNEIIQENVSNTISAIAPDAAKIIARAKELTDKGILWHHHMLFPDCMFNSYSGKWTIVLEDPENNEDLEAISVEEPKSILKEIEPLFYQQQA